MGYGRAGGLGVLTGWRGDGVCGFPPMTQKTRHGWGTRHPSLIPAFPGTRHTTPRSQMRDLGHPASPPFPQRARKRVGQPAAECVNSNRRSFGSLRSLKRTGVGWVCLAEGLVAGAGLLGVGFVVSHPCRPRRGRHGWGTRHPSLIPAFPGTRHTTPRSQKRDLGHPAPCEPTLSAESAEKGGATRCGVCEQQPRILRLPLVAQDDRGWDGKPGVCSLPGLRSETWGTRRTPWMGHPASESDSCFPRSQKRDLGHPAPGTRRWA